MTDPPRHQPLRSTVLRGARLAGLGYALSQGLNLAIYLVIARLVTPSEYGVYAAASLVVGVGLMFSGGGLQAALIQRHDRMEEAANTALLASLASGLLLGLLALAVAPAIGWFFHSTETAVVAAALAGWVPLRSAAIVPDALMQRNFAFMRRLVTDPAGIVAFGAVAIPLAGTLGVWALVIGTYASAVVRLALAWILAHWKPAPRLASFAMWREMARFGRHIVGGEILRMYTFELPAAVVGRSLGTAALGQYRYGERFGMQPQGAVTDVLCHVLLPAFARIAPDRDRFQRAFMRAFRGISAIAFPMGMILLPLGVPIVQVLLGDEWSAAGYVVMALCGYAGSRSIVAICIEAFKVTDNPHQYAVTQGLSAVTMTAGVLALLSFGLTGVAVGITLSAVAVAVYCLVVVSRILELPLSRLAAELWPPIVASLVMVGCIWPLDRLVLDPGGQSTAVGVVLLVIEGLIGAVVYALVLLAVSPGARHEARELAHGLPARLRRGAGAPELGTEGG